MAFSRGFQKTASIKVADGGNGFLGGSMVDSAIAAKKAMPKPPAPPANTGIMGKAFGSIRGAFGS